jgi:MFS family permease
MHLLQFWHLIALAPLFGIVSSFFDPAYQAIMPQLVETEALSSANSLNMLSRNLGFLLGPMLGAGCITLFGQASAFTFDGLTFFISALFLLALRLPHSSAVLPPRSIALAICVRGSVTYSVMYGYGCRCWLRHWSALVLPARCGYLSPD